MTDLISFRKISCDNSSIFESNNVTTVKNVRNNEIAADNIKKINSNKENNSFFILGNNLISNFFAKYSINDKKNLNNNYNSRLNKSITRNINLIFSAGLNKKNDEILHLNDILQLSNFDYFQCNDNGFDKDLDCKDKEYVNQNLKISVKSEFYNYVYKAIYKIINLLNKCSEMINARICYVLIKIIPKVEIKYKSLIPHFAYFHLTYDSYILTLLTIKLVECFKSELNQAFLLKTVIKLCLLINDFRQIKELRILALRWLLYIKDNDFKFDFSKYITTLKSYVIPKPYDCIYVKIEKLRILYDFLSQQMLKCNSDINSINAKEIMNSTVLFNNYKYYPFFSYSVISIFKIYFFIICKFPKKEFISSLCEKLKENIRVVPRILPNLIGFLRKIKHYSLKEYQNELILNSNSFTEIVSENGEMMFKEIYKFLLTEFTIFICTYKSHKKLYLYFPLFTEISKEKEINPKNLIIGLRNLYMDSRESPSWKIDNNIIEICMHIINNHSLKTIKSNKIDDLLNQITKCSFDHDIRDRAKFYNKLVSNVEKPFLDTILFNKKVKEIKKIESKSKSTSIDKKKNNSGSKFKFNLPNEITKYSNYDFSLLNISYQIKDLKGTLKNKIILIQSLLERRRINIIDEGSAYFDNKLQKNVNLLGLIDKGMIENSNSYFPISINNADFYESNVNDKYGSNMNKYLQVSDILRLFLSDNQIINNNIVDSNVADTSIFYFHKNKIMENQYDEKEISNKIVYEIDSKKIQIPKEIFSIIEFILKSKENEEQNFEYKCNELFDLKLRFLESKYDRTKFFKLFSFYFNNIETEDFYIKIPIDLYFIQEFDEYCIHDLYSISISFGNKGHLIMKQPILIPYLKFQERTIILNANDSIQSSMNVENNCLSNCNNKSDIIQTFPFFYKIDLILSPKYPIPCSLETQIMFYDSNGSAYTGYLNELVLKFEDYFLPIYFPQINEIITDKEKSIFKEVLFNTLWFNFKINEKKNNNNYMHSVRLIEKSKEKMTNLVKERLGPFLITDIDENPFTTKTNLTKLNKSFRPKSKSKLLKKSNTIDRFKYKSDCILEIKEKNQRNARSNSYDKTNKNIMLSKSSSNNEAYIDSFITDKKRKHSVNINQYNLNYQKIKDKKFKDIHLTYDFSIDKIIEKFNDKIINPNFNFNDNLNYDESYKYDLVKVLIFIPDKYHLLFKIKISENSSIINVRSDCPKIIEYLDNYFNCWL